MSTTFIMRAIMGFRTDPKYMHSPAYKNFKMAVRGLANSAGVPAIHMVSPFASPSPAHPEAVETTARCIAIASRTFTFVPADSSVGTSTTFDS